MDLALCDARQEFSLTIRHKYGIYKLIFLDLLVINLSTRVSPLTISFTIDSQIAFLYYLELV
jgi:hypothetical protein